MLRAVQQLVISRRLRLKTVADSSSRTEIFSENSLLTFPCGCHSIFVSADRLGSLVPQLL
jgi:hypothetical protein